MKNTDGTIARRRGRPRTFDRDAAIDVAMKLFWERGFEATSIGVLASAMDIRSASLYAAFGDKAALFGEAVERYQAGSGYVMRALALTPTGTAVLSLLKAAADHFTGETSPHGCLIVTSLMACDAESSPQVDQLLAAQRRGLEELIRARVEQGIADGDTAETPGAAALARYVLMVFQGLAIAARQGQSRDELERLVSLGLSGWPSKPGPPV